VKLSESVKQRSVPKMPSIIFTDPQSLAEDALKSMSKFKIHHLLVFEATKFVGIVSDRDILFHAVSLGGTKFIAELTVGKVMRKDLPTVSEATEVQRAFALMQEAQSDALPILSGDTITGVVTQTDMMHALEHLLRKRHKEETLLAQEDSILVNPLSQRLIQMLSEIGI
jgi:CBS domain-containing protein